ncbi:hypothetical protein FF011L_41810 [Roseimaritima multifibrata]|uniref:Translational regulator CsrA n=1 Tax=Roseimaritima multifibrata TaxID=1930274 RepID=A0A517MKH0_9BACT|nr:carbon storage regulator [Roseimaritima multifibrata]QDS95385.1 hypothetical protein FF011L_41810 [Roseimaritima multifibrata]
MLVLSRKLNEKIQLGDNITVTVLRIQGNTIRLGIEAPREVRVVRGELEPLEEKDLPSNQDRLFKKIAEPTKTGKRSTAVNEAPRDAVSYQRSKTSTARPLAKLVAAAKKPTANLQQTL